MGNSGLRQHYDLASKTGVLHISDHKLKEVPSEVTGLKNSLRILDLSKNKIVKLPDDINELKQLKQLNVSYNKLELFPDTIGDLRKLEVLNGSYNFITQLPPSFINLSCLKSLYLSSNKLKKFPLQILDLKKIDVVDLSENKITEIPPGMSNFHAQELNLSKNEISVLSDDLHKSPRLQILKLDENCLNIDAINPNLLRDSCLHTISLECNLFETKQLTLLEGYNEYIERYTAMKKKMF